MADVHGSPDPNDDPQRGPAAEPPDDRAPDADGPSSRDQRAREQAANPDPGPAPGEHPTVQRSGRGGRWATIAIAAGLVLAGLVYVAVVLGVTGAD